MTMIIEKAQEAVPQMTEPAVYTIKYTKEVETVDGEKAIVIDENRIERVTKEQLEAQKVSLQAAIKDIDAKLLEISKL
jgi:hypothetical protein